MAMPCSEELRRKRSEAAKRRWSDPLFKARVSEKLRGKTHSVETREKLSMAVRDRLKNPEYRKAMSENAKKLWGDPGYRKRLSEAHKGLQAGDRHPMFGRKHTEESIRKMKEGHSPYQAGEGHPMFGKKQTDESRAKMSASHKGIPLSPDHNRNAHEARTRNGYRHSAETLRKIGDGNRGKIVSPESRKKCSLAAKKLWESAEHARKCLVINSPNKQEIRLMGILDSLYPREWKFVGDGQVVIAGKCPDFINVNGQKKIIELYGERWHRGDDPKDRAEIFAPFGYETLVVWVKELQSIKKVTQILKSFCGGA